MAAEAMGLADLVRLHVTGEHTIAELAELFGVGRTTVYRTIERLGTRGETA